MLVLVPVPVQVLVPVPVPVPSPWLGRPVHLHWEGRLINKQCCPLDPCYGSSRVHLNRLIQMSLFPICCFFEKVSFFTEKYFCFLYDFLNNFL